ncbi:MAG: NUDIX hydrolase [Syntrophobacteraceae bacterium]
MSENEQIVWKCFQTAEGPDLGVFRVRFDWAKNPRNSFTLKATVLEAPDWVTVVALTRNDMVVVVRQYRFGTQKETTEIPAGIIELGESSQEAAIRELREETGYSSTEWEYLGYVEPNPAFLNNRCHHWLARNAKQVSRPELDEGENLFFSEMNLDELRREIKEGRLRNSLALTALAHVFDLRTARAFDGEAN